MAIISLRADQLASRLRGDANGFPKALSKAMYAAAQRGRALMVSRSPVDRGILRNAWKVIRLSLLDQVDLANDQPYAGILERGARPFKISPEGLEALTGWVLRKLQSGEFESKTPSKSFRRRKTPALEKEAKSIAYAISKKWEKLGKKGKFFIRESLPKLAELMDAEVTRCLDNFFNRQGT